MPEHDIGVVVLTNGTGPSTAFSHMIGAFIYDSLLQKPDLDEKYAAEVARLRESAMTRTAGNEKADEVLRGNRVGHIGTSEAAAYTGFFVSDRLGAMEIDLREGGLWLQFGVLSSPMQFVGNDTFLVRLGVDQPLVEFVFVRDGDGINVLDWGGRVFERTDSQ